MTSASLSFPLRNVEITAALADPIGCGEDLIKRPTKHFAQRLDDARAQPDVALQDVTKGRAGASAQTGKSHDRHVYLAHTMGRCVGILRGEGEVPFEHVNVIQQDKQRNDYLPENAEERPSFNCRGV